jgi:hypothetical protein
MFLRVLFSLTLFAALALAPALAQEDLTLPPEFRAHAPAAEDKASDKPSPAPKHRDKATAKDAQAQKQAAAPAREPEPSAAPKRGEEDRVSFGAGWKANNTSKDATFTTSGLPENKNHADEAAGAGALLGMKYKF